MLRWFIRPSSMFYGALPRTSPRNFCKSFLELQNFRKLVWISAVSAHAPYKPNNTQPLICEHIVVGCCFLCLPKARTANQKIFYLLGNIGSSEENDISKTGLGNPFSIHPILSGLSSNQTLKFVFTSGTKALVSSQ